MHNASILAHAQLLRVQNSIIQYLNEIQVQFDLLSVFTCVCVFTCSF